MKTAQELYPEYAKQEYFYGPSDYQPIIDSFGDIILQVDDSDYQGDSRVLYQDGDKIGYLQFGWGSCSGCDALQACDSMQGIQSLIEGLRNDIKWFDDASLAIEFFEAHDWEGDYSWHSDEQKQFVEQAIDKLTLLISA